MSAVMLMQGDCCEKLNEIPAHSVNLVLADPPYGITHQAWDTVLPFEDFLEKNGKRLSQPEFFFPATRQGFPMLMLCLSGLKINSRGFGRSWIDF